MKQKSASAGILDTVNEIITKGKEKRILQLYTENPHFNGRDIIIHGVPLVNFGSCSYIGLDVDDRLKTEAIDAIRRYGVQFSSSRAYLACPLYREWETLLERMFGYPVLLTTSVSLGHHAVIPVVVEEGDAMILDQQVHASVQEAAFRMKFRGVDIRIVRHNNLEELEIKIRELVSAHKRIWYLMDGIYSMYGDYAPVGKIIHLLESYSQLHVYVDDAHGMSIAGKNGTGFVLSRAELHPRMVLATSLNKAFGAGGGLFVFPDEKMMLKVKNCGGPMIFSGPHQVPVIAAGIASARIHLSDEIYQRQEGLKARLRYCHDLLLHHELPVISNPETPINFIGLGLTRVGYNMVRRMMDEGFYTNLAVFPAVPETCTGLRFTVTLHHTYADIENLVVKLADHLPVALAEEGRSMNDIYRAFRKVKDFNDRLPEDKGVCHALLKGPAYLVQHENTIENIDSDLWDRLMGSGSSYDWQWLRVLEKIFIGNNRPEDNWDFHYYIIRNHESKPLLAAFFTVALCKDDMLSNGSVSYQVELKRREDPYLLCSKSFMMGSLLTEGSHLYIDRTMPDWKKFFMLLLDTIWDEQARQKAEALLLRDFPAEDMEMDDFLMEQGFLKINLPGHNVIEELNWTTPEEYLDLFNTKNRKYIRDNVLKYEHFFECEIVRHTEPHDLETWYRLYKNVKEKSFELNTFDLPVKFFAIMSASEKCEIMQVTLKPEYSPAGKSIPVAVTFSIITAANNYCGVIIGLDYNYVRTHNLYKYTLYKTVLRATELKANKILLGFTASDVKRKFGARAVPQCAYIQVLDHYNSDVINSMAVSNELNQEADRATEVAKASAFPKGVSSS
ncbi:MAG: aminotransferase class I/II-fold pyridoxal phosphate-dependent enzyme [Bacteroidetes bacterium]|nr:aminotransferase class I/II-fold pyridoxal phosphate-dependent enzyme [Bacteroidota bacterium]